jgi:hypothetical protein
MAGELLEILKGRNRRRQPLPFATSRQDEVARVPYEQREGSGGGGHADLLKLLQGVYEFSPAADVGDVAQAAQDPSLMNVGIAGLAMLGGPPGDFAKNLLKAKRAVKAKKVYQGTPHTLEAEPGAPFGRLKDEFIGTGEGAAVYGRGHYVAEEPDVARAYRQNLSTRDVKTGENLDPKLRVGGRPIYDEYKRLEDAAMKLPAKEAGKQYDKMSAVEDLMIDGDITSLRDRAKLGSYTDETVEYIEKELAPKFTRKGNVYEMALKTADEDFLMWDKPINMQSEKVQKAVENIIRQANRNDPKAAEKAVKIISRWPARDFYKNWRSGGPTYGGQSDFDAEEMTKDLLDKGVRGIKYLDEGSRDVGKGTSNFVVFDPKDLEILRVLGLAGVAVGVSHASTACRRWRQTPRSRERDGPARRGRGWRSA